jgi:hypothetical protein
VYRVSLLDFTSLPWLSHLLPSSVTIGVLQLVEEGDEAAKKNAVSNKKAPLGENVMVEEATATVSVKPAAKKRAC